MEIKHVISRMLGIFAKTPHDYESVAFGTLFQLAQAIVLCRIYTLAVVREKVDNVPSIGPDRQEIDLFKAIECARGFQDLQLILDDGFPDRAVRVIVHPKAY